MRACIPKKQFLAFLFLAFLFVGESIKPQISFFKEASANVGEVYGFGSRIASLGNAGVAWGSQSFWSYYNPAGLSLDQEKRLQLSLSFLLMQPVFRPISNIVLQNLYTGDGVQVGDVNNSYRSTLGTLIGLDYRVLPEFLNLSVGATAYLPLDQLAYMDTGETYIPEYVLYRARTQRPQVELGVGGDLGHGFHLGLGLHFAFSLTTNASLFVNTSAQTVSTMRFIGSMSPKFAPFIGVIYSPPVKDGSNLDSGSRRFSFGSVFRFPATSDNTMVLNTAARVFGNFAAVDFGFSALSALFYDPMAFETGMSWRHASGARLYLQLDYQLWSQFKQPALLIQQPQSDCTGTGGTPCTVTIAPGSLPALSFENIWIPKIGEEIEISSRSTLRIGYAYRPSIISGVPNEAGNYLDPSKHMFQIGWGLKFLHFLNFDSPCQLDFHLAYHYLELQHIVKTAGNEIGNLNDQKVGSPGYDAGGSVFGGGLSLSMAF